MEPAFREQDAEGDACIHWSSLPSARTADHSKPLDNSRVGREDAEATSGAAGVLFPPVPALGVTVSVRVHTSGGRVGPIAPLGLCNADESSLISV
jgi:hypothetical protein